MIHPLGTMIILTNVMPVNLVDIERFHWISEKFIAGTAKSGIRKVFSRTIKEPQTHIDRLPPTEVVNWSVH